MDAPSTETPTRLTRVPAWIPLAAFAGTSFALALPLLYLARQRRTVVLRKALSSSSPPPPPRRASPSSKSPHLGLKALQPQLQPNASHDPSPSEVSSPGTQELLSAISRVDYSTAIYAGKAFAIATGLVTVGGVLLAVGLREAVGARDTKEFAERMRSLVWSHLPGLTAQIHRPLRDSDSLPPPSNDDDLGFVDELDELGREWTWAEAEMRLEAAYDQGGVPAWIKAAMAEMAVEAKVERTKRARSKEGVERGEEKSS